MPGLGPPDQEAVEADREGLSLGGAVGEMAVEGGGYRGSVRVSGGYAGRVQVLWNGYGESGREGERRTNVGGRGGRARPALGCLFPLFISFVIFSPLLLSGGLLRIGERDAPV